MPGRRAGPYLASFALRTRDGKLFGLEMVARRQLFGSRHQPLRRGLSCRFVKGDKGLPVSAEDAQEYVFLRYEIKDSEPIKAKLKRRVLLQDTV